MARSRIEAVECNRHHKCGEQSRTQVGIIHIAEQIADRREEENGQADERDIDRAHKHLCQHFLRDDALISGNRLLSHIFTQSRLTSESDCRQRIHRQVNQQQLNNGKNYIRTEQRADKAGQNRRHVNRQLEDQELADTLEHRASVQDRAKAEHTYGEWKSNGDGTHTRKCTIQGCTAEETKDCEGGEATCTKKAVCTYCNSEYGALNPSNHSGSVEWVQTEGTHQKKYECCGAEYEAVESHKWENGHCSVCGYGCEHTGGEATCTEKAVCAICKLPYGKVDANNHTGTEEYIKTSTTHEKKYTCCGKVTLVKENHKWKDGVCEICDYKCVHTGGEANCTSGAICENCGMEYTDKEPSKHTGNPEWVQTEDTHKKAYDCCGLEVSAREEHIWEAGVCKICAYHCQHTGGEATCIQKAQCVICNEEYGTYNLGVHKSLKLVEGKAATKAEEGNIEYWHCEDCDRYYVEDNGYVEIQKADTVIAKIADNNNSNGAGSGDAGSNDTGAGSGDVGSNDTGAGSGDAGSNGTGAGSGDVG